jgi:uncharacterized membrane protein YhaH (DUF805 family)
VEKLDKVIDHFFDFRGRIGRLSYLKSILGILVLFVVLMAIWVLLPISGAIATIYALTAAFVCIWTNLAVTSKRLHDMNISAWYLIPFCMPPLWPSYSHHFTAPIMAAIFTILITLFLCCTKGKSVTRYDIVPVATPSPTSPWG